MARIFSLLVALTGAAPLIAPLAGGVILLFAGWRAVFWVQAAIWLPFTAILSAVLLRPIKGATLGLMLKLGMMKPDDE